MLEETLYEKFKGIGMVLGVVSLVFTMGYNWRGIEELSRRQAAAEKHEADFMRQDVATIQFSAIMSQLAQLQRQMESLARQGRTAAPPTQ